MKNFEITVEGEGQKIMESEYTGQIPLMKITFEVKGENEEAAKALAEKQVRSSQPYAGLIFNVEAREIRSYTVTACRKESSRKYQLIYLDELVSGTMYIKNMTFKIGAVSPEVAVAKVQEIIEKEFHDKFKIIETVLTESECE